MKPYQNPALSSEERVADLLSRMTLAEKIKQTDQFFTYDFSEKTTDGAVTHIDWARLRKSMENMSVGSVQLRGCTPKIANELQRYAVEQTRLGIPFLFSEEALHGFFDKHATCFPQQVGLAATFQPELGRVMGRCIAAEARAYGVHETFSPVMDLTRDPRYGRVEESYGEDTFLCAEFARETVLGMQGESIARPDTVAAEPKHYVGYGTPVGGLNCAPTAFGRHEVFAYCLPVFEEAFVSGGAWNTMCSYNAIDGQPVSSDHELLTDVLRGQYQMPGFVRTDLTAVSRLYDWHFTAPTKAEAIRQGLEAGVDLQLYDFTHEEWAENIKYLVETGKMDESVIDRACGRVLKLKFALGLFENPYIDETLYAKTANCEAHQQTALEIARKSICLLKNEENLLPLSKNLKKIAVVGPGADAPALGDYCTNFDPSHMVTVVDGIRQAVGKETEILYAQGCSHLGEQIIPFHPGWLIAEDGRNGLTGRYYNGWDMEGDPVVTTLDQRIQFNWLFNKPHPDLHPRHFSAVWTGKLRAPETFTGCIGLSSTDSMRLYIDGKLLVDGWGAGKESSQLVDFSFENGREYDVRIEFRNDAQGARVIFGYNRGHENPEAALEAVRQADVAIVCLGDSTETCGENLDRADLNLPGGQLAFLQTLYAAGTPLVLVLQNGRPLTLNWEQAHIPAILECWYPGEKGGKAIADVLFGDIAPSGRLPMSFPKSIGQIPCNYNRMPGGGKRYVEMDWEPLYPFGYGLTYTQFSYSDLEICGTAITAAEVENGAKIKISLTVTNTGDCFGEETVQLYLRDEFASVVKPRKELAAFQKIPLAPGESRRVEFFIGKRQLRTLGMDYKWRVEPGDFTVMAGKNAANVFLTTTITLH